MEAFQFQQYVSATASATSHNHHRFGTADMKLATGNSQEQYTKKPSVSESGTRPAGANAAEEEKKRGQTSQPESTINETIKILLDHHIVENRKLLNESYMNLDKIADYCDVNYLQSDRKDLALEETKNYTTRSLASVANQIHSFAANLLTLFDLQLNGISELEARSNSLGLAIRFHEERAYRREIGKLTKPKLLPCAGAPKVLRPLYPERYAAKKRRTNYYSISSSSHQTLRQDSDSGVLSPIIGGSIDYSILDDIGQAHKVYERRGMLMTRSMAGGIYSTGVGGAAAATANGYGSAASVINSTGMTSSLIASGGGHSLMTGGAGGFISTSSGSGDTAAAGAGLAGQRHWMPSVKSATLRPSKSSNLSAALSSSVYPSESVTGSLTSSSSRTPAPTVRPPTPPLGSGSATMSRFSSLSRGAGGGGGTKDYRSLGPLVVAPPQLPSNYQSTSALQIQQQQSSTLQPVKKSGEQPQQQQQSQAAKIPQNTLQNTAGESSQTHQRRSSPSTNPFLNDLQTSGTSGSQHSNGAAMVNAAVHKTAKRHPTTGVNAAPVNSHWIPSTYIQKVVALYDYNADKDDELTFKESSVIYVTAKNDDGWWEGVMNGITGLFPGNYVEPCQTCP